LGAKIEKKSPHPPVSAIFSVPLSFCHPSRRTMSLPASLQVASPTTSRPPGTTVGPSLSLSLSLSPADFFLLFPSMSSATSSIAATASHTSSFTTRLPSCQVSSPSLSSSSYSYSSFCPLHE